MHRPWEVDAPPEEEEEMMTWEGSPATAESSCVRAGGKCLHEQGPDRCCHSGVCVTDSITGEEVCAPAPLIVVMDVVLSSTAEGKEEGPDKFEEAMNAAYGDDFYAAEEEVWKSEGDVRRDLLASGEVDVAADDAKDEGGDENEDVNEEKAQEAGAKANEGEGKKKKRRRQKKGGGRRGVDDAEASPEEEGTARCRRREGADRGGSSRRRRGRRRDDPEGKPGGRLRRR
mmetsp:Transcript_30721/g.65284  ORF Transcript_30721/g.65284 Transcript_30721/m.65284 type:complete len:229 (+) Transcript_30721:555-1241(+)